MESVQPEHRQKASTSHWFLIRLVGAYASVQDRLLNGVPKNTRTLEDMYRHVQTTRDETSRTGVWWQLERLYDEACLVEQPTVVVGDICQ
jgi:hypothetical protein